MKRILFLLIFALLVGTAFAADTKAGAVSLKGWLGDEMCGAKKGPEHADCAKACVKMGHKVVLVDDAEGKVYKIQNQDAVKPHAGEHVQVDASKVDDGTLKVNKIAELK